MYDQRFGERVPDHLNVDQLRGVEGARVRALYGRLAQQFGVPWQGRKYDPSTWGSGDLANRCLSAATACLYGVTEAAVLAAGFSPALGFIHTGKPLSFVYDIADIYKFETVVPVAFRVASTRPSDPERATRHACRDAFRQTKILDRIIPDIQDLLAAAKLPDLGPFEGAIGPYLPEDDGVNDARDRD